MTAPSMYKHSRQQEHQQTEQEEQNRGSAGLPTRHVSRRRGEEIATIYLYIALKPIKTMQEQQTEHVRNASEVDRRIPIISFSSAPALHTPSPPPLRPSACVGMCVCRSVFLFSSVTYCFLFLWLLASARAFVVLARLC